MDVKSIKRLINGKGYYVTLYISEETNNDIINNLIEFDNNIIDEIVNNSSSWFNKNFAKEDVDELYTRSFCKQTKTINVIISSNNFNNITYNNDTIIVCKISLVDVLSTPCDTVIVLIKLFQKISNTFPKIKNNYYNHMFPIANCKTCVS